MGKKKTSDKDENLKSEVVEVENNNIAKEDDKNSDKAKQTNDKMEESVTKKSGKGKLEDNKLEKLKKEIKAKEDELKEMQDKYIRLSAEFDNYRKRTLKEKMDLTKYAGEDLLKDILPVIDDFERGMNNVKEGSDIEAIKQGMELIQNKFKNFISQKGLKEIEALNQEFNMDLHEAITKIPAPEEKLKGKIVDVIEKGYYLNDKVIRFAKVVIGE